MRYSYCTSLYCPKCGQRHQADEVHHLCSNCESPLLVEYDLEALKREASPENWKERSPDLWRYHELLPVSGEEHVVTMGEGMTPVLQLMRYGRKYGFSSLYIKDEGLIPTGSFKARGASVGVSRAKELGAQRLVMPTNGNAGASWSQYAARAGVKMTVVMPQGAPEITKKECVRAGADLYLVDGTIADAGKVVARTVETRGWYDASTLKEPYRIEGKKTMGLELYEQFAGDVPDVILYPTGGGVGLIGIYKAFTELRELGWLKTDRLPRLVAVQAEGCAPIVQAWEKGETSSQFWPDSHTVAFGIRVPKALGDFLVLEAIYETNGCAVGIRDEQLLKEQRLLAESEGLLICPEGACALAAARKLLEEGWIKAEEKVVVLNTGSGLKYPETFDSLSVPTVRADASL